jgi:tetratricopeptide (TPR) repeat protein
MEFAMTESRKTNGVALWLTVVAAVTVLYALSSGPANWVTLKGYVPSGISLFVSAPLFRIVGRCPDGMQEKFGLWLSLWHPRNWDEKMRLGMGEELDKALFNGMPEAIAREALQENAAAYCARGVASCETGKFDEAVVDLSEAIRLDPQDARALVNRGIAWAGKKDFDKAITDFNEAIRLDPKLAPAYGNRSLAWQDTGEYEKALSDIEEMIRLAPGDVFAHSNCAWLLATCPDGKCRDGKRAVELATTACELSAWTAADDVDTLAAAYAEAGDFENAIKWQERALELSAPTDRDEFRGRLALFKSHKPYRDEPMK